MLLKVQVEILKLYTVYRILLGALLNAKLSFQALFLRESFQILSTIPYQARECVFDVNLMRIKAPKGVSLPKFI